jgi:hypothetical protein
MEAAKEAILDLLLQGPSSLAALHGFLVREGVAEGGVDWTWLHLEQLEKNAFVSIVQMTGSGQVQPIDDEARRAALSRYQDWLGPLGAEDLSVASVSLDEIGLWCALTKKGRAAILSVIGETEGSLWMLDFDEESRRLVVHAADERAAREGLDFWLKQHPTTEFEGEPTLQPVERFTLRSGIEVAPAVRLVLQCRAQPDGEGA